MGENPKTEDRNPEGNPFEIVWTDKPDIDEWTGVLTCDPATTIAGVGLHEGRYFAHSAFLDDETEWSEANSFETVDEAKAFVQRAADEWIAKICRIGSGAPAPQPGVLQPTVILMPEDRWASIDGAKCRVWRGVGEHGGTRVTAYVAAVDTDDPVLRCALERVPAGTVAEHWV